MVTCGDDCWVRLTDKESGMVTLLQPDDADPMFFTMGW